MVELAVTDHNTSRVGRRVAVKTFQTQGNVEQFSNDLLFFSRLIQLWFFGNRFLERKWISWVSRDQFTDTIHLPVWHLQYAAHIAQHSPCLQTTEGDDLRYLIAAIFILNIFDHFLAAILTEIDIEIWHGQTFRIKEAFEKQREAQGIKIGNP